MLETHLRKDRQTIKLGLIKITNELFPGETFETVCSIPDGIFCQLAGSTLSIREVTKIDLKLREWINGHHPIQFLDDQDGYYQYKVGDLLIKTIHPANENSSLSDQFRIVPFFGGYVVDFSTTDVSSDFSLPRRLSFTYGKYQLWLNNLGIKLCSDVNSYIRSGRYQELINIAEAMQEKEIADIADMVMRERRAVKVILIAGPSSSGKTTFSYRLSTQLRVNGLKPVPLALDDYFLNREFTPKDEHGQLDFDAVEALDLALLSSHLVRLINGEKVQTPIFDFKSGCRSNQTHAVQLGPDDILVLEGIHALNPVLVKNINKSVFFKIYVSALFGLSIDYMNRVPTTDVRLIRRMVRDEKFRGFMPDRTMNQWSSVRRGERKHIFKFQEECDVMFNSSLIYEMNALKPFAEHILATVSEDSPHYETKMRLLRLLSFFEPIDHSQIPFNSILREFIGGNVFPPSQHDYNLFLHSQPKEATTK